MTRGKKGQKTMSKAKKVAETLAHAVPSGGSMEIPLHLIDVDAEFNVRQTMDEEKIKELAKSMDTEGQIQDVIVEPTTTNRYTLRAGFRRLAAAKILEWETIKGTVWIPTDDKGNQLTDEKEKQQARYFLNLAENVARQNVSTFDLAFRCKKLKRSLELKGEQIAKRLGKATSYINNLLRITGEGEKGEHAGNTLHPDILKRWQEESAWTDDDPRGRVCRMNELLRWVKLSHEDQRKVFEEEMFVAGGGDRDEYRRKLAEATNGTSAAGAGAGGQDAGGNVRAGTKDLMRAREAVERELAAPKIDKERKTRLNGILEGIDFALGVKRGSVNRIRGVCAFKDGEMIEGAPKKEKEKETRAQA